MAKLITNKMIVSHLLGSTRTMKIRRGFDPGDPHDIVGPLDDRDHEPSDFPENQTHLDRVWRDPTLQKKAWTSPPTHHADCHAWKECDLHYTRNRDEIRQEYTRGLTRPCRSGYDAWMAEAIPHCLRGLPKSIYPVRPTGWKMHELEHISQAVVKKETVDIFLRPSVHCQTHGLFDVQYRAASVDYEGPNPNPLEPPFPPVHFHLDYEVRWTVGFWNWLQQSLAPSLEQDLNACSVAEYDVWIMERQPLFGPARIYEDLDPLHPTYQWRKVSFHPHWFMLYLWPPKMDVFGRIYPAERDTKRHIKLYFLKPGARFLHWTHHWPSKKGDYATPLDRFPTINEHGTYTYNGTPLDPAFVIYSELDS